MLRKPATAAQRTPTWLSLPHLLSERAQRHPDRPALTFMEDDGSESTLTYAALHDRVIGLAHQIGVVIDQPVPRESASRTAAPTQTPGTHAGERALLLFPSGLEFIVAFFACQYCRLVPVPTCFPKPGRAMPRLEAAAKDCTPRLLLSDSQTLASIDPKRVSSAVTSLPFLATDANDSATAVDDSIDRLSHIESTDLGLLQYTSGSTNDPKGVMVSHSNLMTNLESICQSFGLRQSDGPEDDFVSALFWLPLFHDMGLIGGVLEVIYLGGHTSLMSAQTFLSKPLRWLTAISNSGAAISGAPNFAFELCLDRISSDQAAALDLAHWDVAFCGAEPIAVETLDRFHAHFAPAGFRADAFIPCYGLAEATLLVASSRAAPVLPRLHVDREDLTLGRATPVDQNHPPNQSRAIVCCGEPCADMRIEIISPDQRTRLAECEIGEIWLQGGSIAQGYWNRDDINDEQFHAHVAGDQPAGKFLRTGDLGFIHNDNLYVTGRRKDVIILRGRNHFPQDIEATVQRSFANEAIRCVAVAIDAFVGEALSVIAEVSRHVDDGNLPKMVRQIRRQIIEEHEADPRQVVLTRPGAIPVTSSGKVQRAACRQRLQSGEILARYEWSRSILVDNVVSEQLPALPQQVDESSRDDATRQIEAWMMAWMIHRGGIDAREVGPETRFADYGLDSMTAVELSGELDDWLGVELTPTVAWNYPTAGQLAAYLADEMVKMSPR